MADAGRRVFKISKQIRNVGRLGQIATVFARHGFGSFLDQVGINKWLSADWIKRLRQIVTDKSTDSKEYSVLAIHFRMALEELGPSFVKLGQMLAVREDFLPDAFIVELKKLHSGVNPVPFEEIHEILKAELGDRLARLEKIESEPLACGSIGQVYPAVLKGGQKVVLKVQRPAIENQIKIDLDLMEFIANLLERHVPELRFSRPVIMIEEFRRATLGELDYIREAANTTRVAHNFAGKSTLVVPEVYWELTTSRVLALSWMEGVPLEQENLDQQGLDSKVLLDRGVGCFLQMVFVDGFYHGDLHPGNILALEYNRVGLLDFGVTVRIGRAAQRHLAGLMMCLINEDYEGLVSHFVELSNPGSDFDHYSFIHELTNALSPYIGLTISNMKSGKLLWNIASISAKCGAPMPRELILFFRTVAAFEGIANELDPGFDMIKACEKFTGELTKEMYSTENLKQEGLVIARDVAHLMRFAPFQLRRLLSYATEGNLSVHIENENFSKMSAIVDRASARLSLSLIVTALILGSAILAHSGKLERFDLSMIPIVGFGLAGFVSLFLIYSIIKGKH